MSDLNKVNETLNHLGNTLSFRKPTKDLETIFNELKALGLYKVFKPYYSYDDSSKVKHRVIVKFMLTKDSVPQVAELNF